LAGDTPWQRTVSDVLGDSAEEVLRFCGTNLNYFLIYKQGECPPEEVLSNRESAELLTLATGPKL